jgi:hypothetical protein
MYRIELAPGEETVFRTIEELAVAARNGLVTPRCRIYHNASQKWLPIEFHPHYKRALSLPAARVAEAAAPRTSGHPPPLETLSFAVAPAARPTPVAEPVAEPAREPAAETRAEIPAAQARPQTRQSPRERSVTKHPGEAHRDEYQGGRSRSGAENSAPSRPSKERSPAPHSSKDHPSAEQSGAGHPGTDDLDDRYAVVEHPVSNQPATEQAAIGRAGPPDLAAPHSVGDHAVDGPSVADHSVTHHPVTEPPVTEGPATKYQLTKRPVTKHAVTKHAVTNHPATDHPATDHPATDHPQTPADAAMVHPAVEHAAAKAAHADMAADMTGESPIQAAPPAAPMPKSSPYRPDSYLPPSGRAIADDPHIAIAPEPAAAPPVPARPVRSSWSMMPAVQETPELPTISYPEFTPAVEPVAERASSSRGHRPLQVAVAVLVLAAGGYLARSFYSPVRGSHADGEASPAAVVADRPGLPKDSPPPIPTAVRPKPSPVRPAVITPTAPASSGFAAALEPRAIATGPAPILPANAAAAQLPRAVSVADSTAVPSIAPAPSEIQIDVPALPGSDSLMAQPRSKSDSAMKRILRAVNGGQDPK